MRNQKSKGRQMDEIGRIVIPADICKTFEWGVGTNLAVEISDRAAKSITIREIPPCCSLCRKNPECLVKIEKGYMCLGCLEKIDYHDHLT